MIFLILSGITIHAEEANNNQATEIIDQYNYNKIASQQKPAIKTVSERMMLIDANILNVKIVAALYAFSLIIIIVLMRITDHHAKDIVTIVGLISVIFGTLLLVLMISDTQQLIAPIGIFGAIAGYLFGAAPKKEIQKDISKE